MLRFFFPFLALIVVAMPAHAMQPNGCPDYEPPVVIIHELFTKPKINTSFGLGGIKQLALEGQKDFSSTPHETPVGLTSASLKLETQYEINVRQNPTDPLICAQIKTFTVNYGFDDTTVYLAQELPPNSCSLHTVMEHEQRHVTADYDLIISTSPYLKDQMRQALARIGTLRASSGEVAEKQIQSTIRQYMKDLGHNLSLVRQKHQALIDTTAEYDRLSRSCDGALSNIIRESRGR